eukprot:200476_1
MGNLCNFGESIDETKEERTVQIKSCGIYELYNAIAVGTRDLLLLDLRSVSLYKENHIVASINFDISDENIYNNKDNEIAVKLSKWVKKKLINSNKIFIIYDEQFTDEQINEMNEYFKATVVPMICKSSSWLDIKTIYYCSLYKQFIATFDFLLTTEIVDIEPEDDKKETSLHPIPISIFGKDKMFPSCIIQDELYLGNSRNAADGDTLKSLGITHVVNVTVNIENYFEKDGIKYLQFKIEDNPSVDISIYFNEAIEFIDNALSETNNKVFVHCQAGISRSASVVIAYIMTKRNIPIFSDALDFVRTKRCIVYPNDGFTAQLKQYQTQLA